MITTRDFGYLPDGDVVTAFDFTTEAGFTATILSYGATLQSLIFPDGTDVVLGFDNLEGYLGEHPYFGAVIGRIANRTGEAYFDINDMRYDIPANEGVNNLHSGPQGFDRVNWAYEIKDNALILRHTSPDGHQGFPGKLQTELRFQFDNTTLVIEIRASTDKATPVNITYHPYFNFTNGGKTPCTDHMLEIFADDVMQKNEEHLPTGMFLPNTYNKARRISDTESQNLDYNFVIRTPPETGMFKHAKLWSETTGHKIIICSTQPCLQAYTGKSIPSLKGKAGRVYGPNHGIALEPQGYVDSFNHDNFPTALLKPDETYNHKINYTFRPGEAQV